MAAVMSDLDKSNAFVKFEKLKSFFALMFRLISHASESGEAPRCKWRPRMRKEYGLGSLILSRGG